MGSEALERIVSAIEQADSFLLFAHENPDGDAIGSSVAAGLILKKLGKTVDYAIDGKTKDFDEILEEMHQFGGPRRSQYDAAFILDCSTRTYIENNSLLARCDKKILVDHHLTNEGFADASYVEADSAATGELVYLLAVRLGVAIDPSIAKALYLALYEDTGGFRHGNTTSRTHYIISRLYETEPELYTITQWLKYYPRVRLDLTKLALENMTFYYGDRMCLTIFTYENGFYPYRDENVEKIIDLGKHVRGCEFAVFIRQSDENTYKISMRCVSDNIDIAALSKEYGGGGHIRAAGFSYQGDLEKLVNMFISLGEKLVK
jgi:phosphoesterase RecJ-like protein